MQTARIEGRRPEHDDLTEWRIQTASGHRMDLKLVAQSAARVLVTASSSHDRAAYARFIHDHSARANGPFVVIDGAGAAPARLRRRGDADPARVRRGFELARGGTLFIDRVVNLDTRAQALLNTILDGERRSWQAQAPGAAPRDARLISGAERSLFAAVAAGEFDETLYYRLNVVHLDFTQQPHSLHARFGGSPV